MFCESTKNSYSPCPSKAMSERCASLQHNDSRWLTHRFLCYNMVQSAFLAVIVFGAYRWFSRWKLRYMLRITLGVFIFSTITFWIPFDFYILSFFISCCENSSWNFVCTLCFEKLKRFYCFLTLLIFTLAVRYRWGEPVNFIKDSSSTGFSHLERMAKSKRLTVRELSGKMLRHRDPGEMNPVYVNGWIPLIESSQVNHKEVVSAIAMGHKFCVFRGENGMVSVMDAYCPHMGADLSAGGQIIGNSIECPFHGWQFCGETGKCTKIPYSDKVPDVAKAKIWDSCEKNGFVFVWYHAENDPPSWELPSIPEIEDGSWVYRGRSELTAHCHIQEIPENGADINHLPQVHSRFVFFGPYVENAGPDGRWIRHDWEPKWVPDPEEPHCARVNIDQRLVLFGFEVPWTRIEVKIRQIGPATVYLHMKTKFGRGVLCQHITTEGPLTQKIVHLFYTEPKFHHFPASFLIWGEAVMIQRDIEVWNNKKFLKNPLLVKEDKSVQKFRRWYSQFYSEHSPTMKDLQQKTLSW